MNEEAMRKAFEDERRRVWGAPVSLQRDRDGTYVHLSDRIMWDFWQAATRAAVQDGWKVVPFEPTPAMINDARVGLGSCMGSCGEASPPDDSDIADALRCAIAAAPELKP